MRSSTTASRVSPHGIVALLVLVGCSSDEPPGPIVIDAHEIGVLDEGELIRGRDGGSSAELWGKSVWTFGDTVLRVPDVDGETWHHNSYGTTDDRDASDGIGGLAAPLDAAGAPVYLIPPTPSEQAFNEAHRGDDCAETPCGARWAAWPGEPVYDAAADRALVFYGLIYSEPGEFNFEGVGGSIAIWDALDAVPRRPEVDPDAEHPTLVFEPGDPTFGAGVEIEGDRLYSFACDSKGFDHVCRLGRVQLGHELDRSAWEMWDGDDWTNDLRHGAVLFVAAPIVSIGHVDATDEWLAIYSPPFDGRIFARTAPERTGPWSAATMVYDVPAGEDEPYDAIQHREYAEQGGLVQYVTYSRARADDDGGEFPIVRVELAPDE